ncbi:integral membrane protein [Golovinomyces cichoracearum]|uniref:Integral membrane protein n=1 Tax=Golovinomyces cichoracearum TaxID=62708 RepID=A0A420IPB9_9PEZI|nr:integral membrane protein [Golovinomyces cichoracearum]
MEKALKIASSSLDPLTNSTRSGMIAIGVCGSISLFSAVSSFLFFTYRILYWPGLSSQAPARRQVFMLIYNLFIADIIQASSFVISFWWISQNKLIGPSLVCDTQGVLIQIGDVASGLWALAIAIHTFFSIVKQKTVSHRIFVILLVILWAIIMILATVGPIRAKDNFFAPAGAWCWVSEEHHAERLYLHYIWIFMSELGSVILYTSTLCHLYFLINTGTPRLFRSHLARSYSRNAKACSASRTIVMRCSCHMVMYIFAYLGLTLPLAAGRAMAMVNREPSIEFFIAAGTLIACSGFVDVVLYVGTRNLLATNCVTRESIDMGNGNGTQPLVEGSKNRCSSNTSSGMMMEEANDRKYESCESMLLSVNTKVVPDTLRDSHEGNFNRMSWPI